MLSSTYRRELLRCKSHASGQSEPAARHGILHLVTFGRRGGCGGGRDGSRRRSHGKRTEGSVGQDCARQLARCPLPLPIYMAREGREAARYLVQVGHSRRNVVNCARPKTGQTRLAGDPTRGKHAPQTDASCTKSASATLLLFVQRRQSRMARQILGMVHRAPITGRRNRYCLDHLKNLGITHGPPSAHPKFRGQAGRYSWGYATRLSMFLSSLTQPTTPAPRSHQAVQADGSPGSTGPRSAW